MRFIIFIMKGAIYMSQENNSVEKQGPIVYVLSKDGKPLMPTRRGGKVRVLRKAGMAKVVCRDPFTIQLLYDAREYIQKNLIKEHADYIEIGLKALAKKNENNQNRINHKE
jgi:hypothetical protein